MNKVRAALEVLMLALACVFIVYGILAMQEARSDVAEVKAKVESISAWFDSTRRASLVLLQTAAKTSENIDKSSAQELTYWSDANQQLNLLLSTATKTAASLNTAIGNTDNSINKNLLPAATGAVADMHAIEVAAASGIAQTTEELKPMIQNGVQIETDVTKLIEDPNVVASLINLRLASTNLPLMSSNTAEALGHFNHISALADAEVTAWSKPASKVKKFFGGALTGAGWIAKWLIH